MYKPIFTLLALLSSSILFAQPCTPASSAGCILDYISYFSLKGESGTEIQSPSACSVGSYSDYTASFAPVNLTRGYAYSGHLQTSNPDNYVTIWIDEDNDLVFEDQERLVHNLRPGSGKLLYGIYIPSLWSLGQHRMRVRLAYYSSAPAYATLTDPCNLITFSETEDYLVNITNAPGTSFVASGTAGACSNPAVVSIGTATNNNTAQFVQVRDSNNNYVCQIYPNGNTLGAVKTTLYLHNGPVRQDSKGISMIDRNITIEPEFQAVNTYNLRFFYLNSELYNLIAMPGSGVTSQFDLVMTKNQQVPCATQVNSSVPLGSLTYPTGFGSMNGDRFLDMTNLTSFSTFYLHGGSTALGNPAISLDAHPITLSLQQVDGAVDITWHATPDQLAGFELQRSENGTDFSTIYQTSAESGSQTFNYKDNPLFSNLWFYRVRMQLADGRVYFSAIQSWKNEKSQLDAIQLIQNPVSDNLSLQVNKESTVQIFNQMGQQVLKTLLTEGIQSVNIAQLASGSYVLVSGNQRIMFLKAN